MQKFKISDDLKSKVIGFKKDISVLKVNEIGTDYTYKHEVLWKNVIGLIILHLLGLWGLYIVFILRDVSFGSFVCAVSFSIIIGEGVLMGAHRYYSHKSFKSKPLLRAIFILAHTMAGQRSMYWWCRNHRLHHRYSDTDADPHNSKRGFFFSHIGWLMVRRHPLVIQEGEKIDLSDLEADWMVMFQKKYYIYLYLIFGLLLPIWMPVQFFGEPWWKALLTNYFAPYVVLLNIAFLVNSAAHLYGTRPYDKNIQPVDSSFVSYITFGEGWHNYHHAFPWDYRAAELPSLYNNTAALVRFFEKIGLAYDLKIASPDIVMKRMLRTGDGTHSHNVLSSNKGPLHTPNPTCNSTSEYSKNLSSTENQYTSSILSLVSQDQNIQKYVEKKI